MRAPSLILAMVAMVGCSQAQDWSLAENRMWIERMPAGPKDMVKQLAFVNDEGQRVGVDAKSSRYRMMLDLFMWEQQGAEVRMVYPQTDTRLIKKVRAWKCAGEAPRPFELCLELGAQRYFSREDWVIRDLAHASAPGPWTARDDATE